MANQITVQVYAIDNIPQRNALNVSFPTNQISAQLATSVLATNIQSQINYYPNPNNQAQLTEVLVSQSISDIATLASNSMFAASIYKINGYPQGGQALSMLFPSVQPSIWSVSGGGDVRSFVQFKGKKYYAHETGAALATAANTADGGGGGVTNITYAALVTAIGANGLTVGQQYKITDRGDRGLFFTAISTSQLANDGVRLMLCPSTYNTATDGNGNVWIGVWNAAKSVNINELTIWGGKVWKNLTGAIGSADDDVTLDATNWILIDKTSFSNHEYIEMTFGCSFDVVNDWVIKQWDGNGNIFGRPYSEDVSFGYNKCSITDWNWATSGHEFSNNQASAFSNNSCTGLVRNNIAKYSIMGNSNGGRILDNTVGGDIINNSNTGDIQDNILTQGVDTNSNNGRIYQNIGINIYNNSNSGEIYNNQNNGQITNIGSANTDIRNNINNGDISTTTTGEISDTIVNK